MTDRDLIINIQSLIDDHLENVEMRNTEKEVQLIIKRLDNLHIETRPISPEQNTKFLYYNMAVDDCIKVVRAYLESVKNE